MSWKPWTLGVVVCAAAAATIARPAESEDRAKLLAALPASRLTLADGIREAEKTKGAAISAKFELDHGGKLSLSVYTAGKGLAADAEHNVLQEHAGSPLAAPWKFETEVFEDVPHVARSAQQLTLASLATASLLDVATKAEKAGRGTVLSVTPRVRDRKGVYVVETVADGAVSEWIFDLAGEMSAPKSK
jgi:hypothetical protein